MIGYMIRIVFTYTSKYGNDYINTCSINDLNVGFVYGKATEPLPAKAGRFGVLLKQPKACTLKGIFLPLLLSLSQSYQSYSSPVGLDSEYTL